MIVIKQSADGQWYFIAKAANGKTLVQSETYKRKRSAYKGIAALKKAVKGKVVEK